MSRPGRAFWFEVGFVVLALVTAAAWFHAGAPREKGGEAGAVGAPSPVASASWPSPDVPFWPPGPRVRDAEAFHRGQLLADVDLRGGRAHILAYGVRAGLPALDEQTGLPVVTRSTRGNEDEDEGYRSRVGQYVGVRGFPRNSRKAWVNDLLHPRAWFERQRQAGTVVRLGGGLAVRTPGLVVQAPEWQSVTFQLSDPYDSAQWSYPLPGIDPARRQLDACWGPALSRTLFLSYPARPPGAGTCYVVLSTDSFDPGVLCQDLPRGTPP